MAKAIWNGTEIAASDETIVVDSNHYFPRASVKDEFLEPSNTHSSCHWKGEASYYTLVVDGQENTDAAWYYPTPMEKAENITGYVAFWKGVEVVE